MTTALLSALSRNATALAIASCIVGCGVAVRPDQDAGTDRPTPADVAVPDRVAPPPPDAGSECALVSPSRVLSPSVLFAGQPLGLTVEAASEGCGCRLELIPNELSSARGFDPLVCNCCRECECIDSGYRASVLLGAPPIGGLEIAVTGDPTPRRVVRVVNAGAQCEASGISVRSVTIRGPEDRRVNGPNLYWAEVEGTHRPCCPLGVGFVDRMSSNSFSLEPRSCEALPCTMACPPVSQRPTAPFVSAHLLGDLQPGDYRVSVGGVTVTFNVPR